MIKPIVSVALWVAAFIVYRKTDKVKAAPEGHTGIFAACLIPVCLQFYIENGTTDFTKDFLPLFEEVIYTVSFVSAMQLLIIGAGTSFFRNGDRDGKLGFSEVLPLVAVYVIVSAVDGLGFNLVFSTCMALLSLALYLKTGSLDLSITIHLLFRTAFLYGSFFVTERAVDTTSYKALFAANCFYMLFLAFGILRDYVSPEFNREGKFHG